MADNSAGSGVPQFSVVTVVRNHLSALKDTLRNINSQCCRDFECSVVDGASTDGTPDFLQTCAIPNLRWISEPDEGIYDAMNKGVSLARGRYLIFMNAGDRFADDMVLQRVSSALNEVEKPPIIFGDSFQETASGEKFLKRARQVEAINYGMFTHHQSMFFERSLFPACGFDKTWEIAGDYALVATAYKKGYRFQQLPFAISIFAEGGASMRNQTLGRREAQLVQKEILRVSGVRRGSNRLIHWTSSQVRSHFSPLYNFLRYRSDRRPA